MNIDFPDNVPIFPIRTAAKLLNISVHTLRMYEKEGLIPFKRVRIKDFTANRMLNVECIRKRLMKIR
jgi:MerR family transcriptional regulator/heat shock protein HspR